MYSIADYGSMIADEVRTGAFARALGQAVRPGALVIDIGTGTGILALLACRFGARKVYAIEPDGAIHVAREVAAANGYGDRIEFIQAMSTRVTIPERADVIVSDLGGALPWFGDHIPSIADARRRLLLPGGTLIPQRDVAWAAIVEARRLYARHVHPESAFGFDLEPSRRIVVNAINSGAIASENLLTEPRRWAALDYRAIDDPHVHARITWIVTRSGTGHGIAAGFDRTVIEGICLSNAPDAPDAIRPPHIYPPVFFAWPAPVSLTPGDSVYVELDARPIRREYVWTWESRILDAKGGHKAHFNQSTFFGVPLSASALRKAGASYTPTLTEDGRIARLILELMNSRMSVGEIANRVRTEFPSRFADRDDALSQVARLSQRYG